MATAIIEQFSLKSKCWNKLYEMDACDFNPHDSVSTNKYNGAYRCRVVDSSGIVTVYYLGKPEKLNV